MPGERYKVSAEPEVSQDIAELIEVDERLGDVAIEVMGRLRDDPWLGEDLWERYNMPEIKDCRKIRFDVPDWPEKPRYRIVYRNEPTDCAPGLVRIWALGPRKDLVTYARANARAARERFRTRPRRRGS